MRPPIDFVRNYSGIIPILLIVGKELSLFEADIERHIHGDKNGNGGCHDDIHRAYLDLCAEEIEVAVDRILYHLDHLIRKADARHFAVNSRKGVITYQTGAVCTRQERHDLLKPFRKVRYRHICAAQEAVARADDRSDCRHMSLRCERKIHAGRQCDAEKSHQHNIKRKAKHIGTAHIPPRIGEINKANGKGCKADYQRGGCRSAEI